MAKTAKPTKGKISPVFNLVIRATGPAITTGKIVENTETTLTLSVRRYRSHKRELRVYDKASLIGYFVDAENTCSVIGDSTYVLDDKFSGTVTVENGVVVVTSDIGTYYLNRADDDMVSLVAADEAEDASFPATHKEAKPAKKAAAEEKEVKGKKGKKAKKAAKVAEEDEEWSDEDED